MSFIDGGFLRGVAQSLKVKGIQSIPEEIDMRSLAPIVEIGHETQLIGSGMKIMNPRTGIAVNGLTSYALPLIAPNTSWTHPISGASATVAPEPGYNTIVLGVELYVTLTAAALPGEIGYWIGLKVEYYDIANAYYGPVASAGREIVDHLHRYHLDDNQNVPRTCVVVPHDRAFVGYCSTRHATHTFPAGTVLDAYLTYAFVPEGAKTPF